MRHWIPADRSFLMPLIVTTGRSTSRKQRVRDSGIVRTDRCPDDEIDETSVTTKANGQLSICWPFMQ